jgi:hypothetical protein
MGILKSDHKKDIFKSCIVSLFAFKWYADFLFGNILFNQLTRIVKMKDQGLVGEWSLEYYFNVGIFI